MTSELMITRDDIDVEDKICTQHLRSYSPGIDED
jgi:hypothetical protein